MFSLILELPISNQLMKYVEIISVYKEPHLSFCSEHVSLGLINYSVNYSVENVSGISTNDIFFEKHSFAFKKKINTNNR